MQGTPHSLGANLLSSLARPVACGLTRLIRLEAEIVRRQCCSAAMRDALLTAECTEEFD